MYYRHLYLLIAGEPRRDDYRSAPRRSLRIGHRASAVRPLGYRWASPGAVARRHVGSRPAPRSQNARVSTQPLRGERDTVEFVVPASIAVPGNRIGLQAIDRGGYATQHWQTIEKHPQGDSDINGDGVVNILDLVIVASAIGEEGQGMAADVNGDGVVNILDLVMVANEL